MNFPQYHNKKVLILGLGLNQGGVGSARFFAKQNAQVRVTDLKTEKELRPALVELADLKSYATITYTLGAHRYEDIDWADIVIRNQAIKPDNPYLLYAQKVGKMVEMDMGIFLQHIDPQNLIGITGTKGKSTTASLVYTALKTRYPHCVLAGNIGKSVLDSLDQITSETRVILELSSFQLEAFAQHTVSPHIGVITNIYEDHLNYYQNMEAYIAAKQIIGLYQSASDYLILGKDDKVTTDPTFLSSLKGCKIYFSTDDIPENFQPVLVGEHNKANYAAALKVAGLLGINAAEALMSMNTFIGVPFRQELIREWQGIKIYNDTAATSPEAAINAVKTFDSVILIAGGVNKNLPYEKFAITIDEQVKAVYFLAGDATDKIIKHMEKRDKIKGIYTDFDSLLNDLKPSLKPGDTLILSPGAASFNLFQNEFDRGRKFTKSVQTIFSD